MEARPMCHKLVAILTVRHQNFETFRLESVCCYAMQKIDPIERRKRYGCPYICTRMKMRIATGGHRSTLWALHKHLYELCWWQPSVHQTIQPSEQALWLWKAIGIERLEGNIYTQKVSLVLNMETLIRLKLACQSKSPHSPHFPIAGLNFYGDVHEVVQ